MKKIFLILSLSFAIFSCEDFLEKEPDFISEAAVFESEALTNAYMAKLYESMPFINLGGGTNINLGIISAVGMEHTNFATWQSPNGAVNRLYDENNGPGAMDYWPYANMRDANYLLENIVNSSSLSQSFINEKVAETRFLRAYMYFEMVRRWGGVPLVTKVLAKDAPDEDMYPARNTEKEVYDFIYSELNDIASVFSEDKRGAAGRVDRYTVLALQSRAMLYAASIAQNGNVYLDGVVGIPSGEAAGYYQKSFDASQTIIDAGVFSLYNKSSDKEENYRQLFLDEGNDEVIFAEVFEAIINAHSFDILATPQGYDASWNANFPVFYDFVELFEFEDGSPAIPRSELNAGNTWNIDEFFGKRDPRFRASVFYPESEYRGATVYFHTSTTYTEGGTEKTSNSASAVVTADNGKSVQGAAHARNIRSTAMLRRKWLSPDNTPIREESGQDYYIFRYGEILLNHAEAAFYLGNDGEALSSINAIRTRAGMPVRTSLTEDNIRVERQVELCFENHRYWDLKRWRIAEETIDGVRTVGLRFDYNLDTDMYTIRLKNATNLENVRRFGPERYYLPFSLGRLTDNPNLVQNPFYND